jgi:predicted  nucleic acid-binding Zn-ribbon protein
MTTTTTRPGLAAANDEWLARKLLEAGYGGPDCDYPDCTNARAPRPEGKPGPPPKFCVQHNNKRDRQFAYRARKALEKERAAAPEPVPVQQAVARGAREEQVLASLLPRVLTALENVHQGQQAGADTAAVSAHIAEVQQAADERVRQAEERREAAVEDAGKARAEAARSEQVAAEARAEQQAAQMEAATALREAAGADGRATAAGAALDALSDTHRQLRDAHHELSGKHEELSGRYQGLEQTHAALTSEHGTLRTEHGRLQGEAQALHARVEELSEEKARIEESQRRTAADLARVQSENTGLAARLGELETHREELKETIGRLNTRLDDERAEHRREVAALRAQLNAARAAAEPAAGVDHGDGPGPDPDEPEPADGDEDTAGAGDRRGAPVAIVDLGVHGGSGWTLVRYEDTHSRWLVLRDGENAGTIQPEHSLHGTSLLGWSARTSYAMPLRPPHGQKHFANREQAAGAVIRDGLRRAPSPAPATAAAAFTALGEPEQNALVAAVIPLATATPKRGGRLARLPQADRDAALRTALRVPGEQDLQQLTGLDAAELGRSKEARHLLRALQDLVPADGQEIGPVDLGTIGGRAWRLEPDPNYLGGYRVLSESSDVGAIAPVVRRRKTNTVRWTATHRRRSLGRGPAHADRDTAARAVITAEGAWVPLPDLDDETYLRIPAGLRSSLYGAASRIDLRRGRLAQIQPGAYRQQLHAAIGQARRTATGRIRGQHLAVILDAAREDLGAPGSTPAQRLYEVIQEIRAMLLTSADTA